MKNFGLIIISGALKRVTPNARMTVAELAACVAAGLFAWFFIAPALQWVLFSVFNFITGKDVPL